MFHVSTLLPYTENDRQQVNWYSAVDKFCCDSTIRSLHVPPPFRLLNFMFGAGGKKEAHW